MHLRWQLGPNLVYVEKLPQVICLLLGWLLRIPKDADKILHSDVKEVQVERLLRQDELHVVTDMIPALPCVYLHSVLIAPESMLPLFAKGGREFCLRHQGEEEREGRKKDKSNLPTPAEPITSQDKVKRELSDHWGLDSEERMSRLFKKQRSSKIRVLKLQIS